MEWGVALWHGVRVKGFMVLGRPGWTCGLQWYSREVGADLVVCARPGGHLHSVHNLLHIHHLKDGKAIPDGDPHVAHDCEVDVVVRVYDHTQEYTCDVSRACTLQQA